MKTDRELLELAVDASGFSIAFGGPDSDICRRTDTWDLWNPLTDDGDALRLAVQLEIDIIHAFGTRTAVAQETAGYSGEGLDQFAATRRAIVRAAAEIGESVKKSPTKSRVATD